jgi:cyanophycinase
MNQSNNHQPRCFVFILQNLAMLLLSTPLGAQDFFERFDAWPLDLRIQGTILLAPSSKTLIEHFELPIFDLSERQLIVLSPSGDDPQANSTTTATALPDSLLNRFANVTFATTVSKDSWTKNSILLIVDDSLSPETVSQEQRKSLRSVVQRALQAGATVAWAGPSCIAMGKHFFPAARHSSSLPVDPTPSLCEGLDCFPDAIVQLSTKNRFDKSNNDKANNDDGATNEPTTNNVDDETSLDPQWKCVSVCLTPDNVVVLSGRKVITYGPDPITVEVPASEQLPAAQQSIVERTSLDLQLSRPLRAARQTTDEYLLDWTQWRRLAIERTLPPFPPTERQTPSVPNGTLIIIGGGATPRTAMNRFVQRAGGAKAKLVFVPCSESEDASNETDMLETWKRMGVESCHLLHTKDRNQANSDESFLAPLQDATGIWFGGGRQWNLADSYYGTQAHRLMKEVLARGGVIAGSSAGASIQAEYLARATPIENFRIMAPGYERGGLGFLRGVAIDQHFTQRGRQKDLQSLVDTYPQLLGIGIDESTAIVVEKSIAEVLGKGQVTFYWTDTVTTTDAVTSTNAEFTLSNHDATVLPNRQEFIGNAGDKFDLSGRTSITPPAPNP